MELLLIFNKSIFPIFFIVFIAFIYNKILHPDIKSVSNVTLLVFAPALVFESMTKQNISIPMMGKPALFMVVLTVAMVSAGMGAAKLLRLKPDDRTSLVLGCSMINIGNFGLPLIYFTFGQEAVAYSVIYFVVFNIPISTLAIYLSSDKTSFMEIMKDVLKIPIFHAMVLALIFSALQLDMPENLGRGITLLSEASIPLLIFVLGLQLSNISFKRGIKRFTMVIAAAAFIRLVLSPVVSGIFLPYLELASLEKNVALIQTSCPAALLPLMYTIKFNKSPELLAAIIIITTLLSGVSLPFIIGLL